MKTQVVKKFMASVISAAVVLTASSASSIPFGLNAIAEPADSSGIISGGANDGYYWTGNTTWEYNPTTKTLTIGGTGDMPDWRGEADVSTDKDYHYCHRPWGSQGKIGDTTDSRSKIEHIVIKEGVTSIGSYAFCNFNTIDTELTIEIPNTVTRINKNAFYYTTRLKTITIPNSVQEISNEAFWHCRNLVEVKLPDKLQTLGGSAFNDCQSLKEITLPETLKRIESKTFYNCRALESIVISESVFHIGENSFEYCTSLTDVTIPQNVIRVTSWAFCHCTSLEHVTFEGTTTIPELHTDVFYDTKFVNENTKGIDIPSCDYLEEYKDKASGNSNNGINNFDYVAQEHTFKYIGDGTTNIIQEICTYPGGCDHTATATLSIPSDTEGLLTENGKQLFFYTGSEIKPVINTYSDNWNGTDDKKPGDIEIKYKDNILVGTAEATLTITNDDGTLATSKIEFEIVSNLKLVITADGWEGIYDGNPHSITVNGIDAPEVADVKYGTTEGTYDLTDNPAYTDVGEHTVYYRVTLEDGSIQTGSATVKITPKPITDDSVDVKVEIDESGNVNVTVKDGDKTLTPDKDYTVTTTEITDINTGKTTIDVTVTGKGNYKDNIVNQVETDSGNKPGDGSGDNPGGDNPGGDNPGGDNPGGNNPGGDTSDNSSDNSDDSSDTSDNSSDTSDDSSDTSDNSSDTSDDSSDISDDSGDNSDNSSGDTSDNNGDTSDNKGDIFDNIGNGENNSDNTLSNNTTSNTSKNDNNNNPTTGNSIARWFWIALLAGGSAIIAVMKSKSNRDKS